MFIALVTLLLTCGRTPPPLQEGISYTAWWHDDYSTAHSDTAIELLAQTGAEWLSILATWYQDSVTDTLIKPDTSRTPTDQSVAHAIVRAQALGLRIMLKPHVDCDTGWRGEIVPDSAGGWFRNYRRFIFHYARLAESLHCEQFCVGTELDLTTLGHEAEWRVIIDTVRQLFHGTITYAANWDRYSTHVPFWDAVDLVGIDAYFWLTSTNNPSLDELIAAWNTRWLPQLDAFQAGVGKPILFTEIGYRSVDSTNMRPWDYSMTGPVDTAEQRDCYEAAFRCLRTRSWFAGFYWWNWTTFPNQGGPDDDGYTPHNKPAERVVRYYYARVGGNARHQPWYRPVLRVIPNPVREGALCRIEGTSDPCRLYDAAGRLVLGFTPHGATAFFSAPALGVYLLKSGREAGAIPIVALR